MCAASLFALAAAWTNPWHGWIWTDILPPSAGLPFAIYEYGWAFWLLTAQHYVLMLLATAMLLARQIASGARGGQGGSVCPTSELLRQEREDIDALLH